ncbi:MAG: hypothetical protein ACXWUG_16275 [Polyangiales bacterium]
MCAGSALKHAQFYAEERLTVAARVDAPDPSNNGLLRLVDCQPTDD